MSPSFIRQLSSLLLCCGWLCSFLLHLSLSRTLGYNTNSCLIWKESLTDTHSFAIFKWPYSAHSVRQHNEQLSYPAAIFLPIVCHVFSCLNVFCCLCSSFAHLTRVNSCGAATQTTPTSVKPRKGHLLMGPSVHLEKWVCLLDLHTINHDQHYKGTTRKKAGGWWRWFVQCSDVVVAASSWTPHYHALFFSVQGNPVALGGLLQHLKYLWWRHHFTGRATVVTTEILTFLPTSFWLKSLAFRQETFSAGLLYPSLFAFSSHVVVLQRSLHVEKP